MVYDALVQQMNYPKDSHVTECTQNIAAASLSICDLFISASVRALDA